MEVEPNEVALVIEKQEDLIFGVIYSHNFYNNNSDILLTVTAWQLDLVNFQELNVNFG